MLCTRCCAMTILLLCFSGDLPRSRSFSPKPGHKRTAGGRSAARPVLSPPGFPPGPAEKPALPLSYHHRIPFARCPQKKFAAGGPPSPYEQDFQSPLPSRLAARARAGQGKHLSVRFAHSPGFSGMVYPTWSVKATENPGAPFAEGFYWPSRTRAPKRPSAEGFYWPAVPTAPPPSRPPGSRLYTSPPPGLACRLGRWSPVATVQRRPKRELKPVRGRAPPALAHPLP